MFRFHRNQCKSSHHVSDKRVCLQGHRKLDQSKANVQEAILFAASSVSVVLKSDDRLKFVACWAHARRYLVESKDYKQECEKLLDVIQTLYDIEQRAVNYSIEERHALRQRESIPVLNAIRRHLDLYDQSQLLPSSPIAPPGTMKCRCG